MMRQLSKVCVMFTNDSLCLCELHTFKMSSITHDLTFVSLTYLYVPLILAKLIIQHTTQYIISKKYMAINKAILLSN